MPVPDRRRPWDAAKHIVASRVRDLKLDLEAIQHRANVRTFSICRLSCNELRVGEKKKLCGTPQLYTVLYKQTVEGEYTEYRADSEINKLRRLITKYLSESHPRHRAVL